MKTLSSAMKKNLSVSNQDVHTGYSRSNTLHQKAFQAFQNYIRLLDNGMYERAIAELKKSRELSKQAYEEACAAAKVSADLIILANKYNKILKEA